MQTAKCLTYLIIEIIHYPSFHWLRSLKFLQQSKNVELPPLSRLSGSPIGQSTSRGLLTTLWLVQTGLSYHV